jgi:protein-S-isoprenylcysteine O-methyltransferase Ste14
MIRFLGIALGFGAHVLLGVTVWFLFPFLRGGQIQDASLFALAWPWLDGSLVLQFGILHSLLLLPPVRDRLERFVPRPLYGCFFTFATSLSLLLLVLAWQYSPVVLWQVTGPAETGIFIGYLLSWVGLFYSLSLTGFGFQTGWTPFSAWMRGSKAPPRTFEVRGVYRVLRHPVYLSFLGLVWFTPLMTFDRALLTGLMTAYIFLGSYLKDQRLLFYLGDMYRSYQTRVPGYPLVGFGPLGRVRSSQSVE